MGVLATMQPRLDQAQTMPTAQASDRDNVQPGWFETVGAGFRSANDRNGWHQAERVGDAYADIVGDVARISGKSPSDYLADRSIHYMGLHNPFAVKGDVQSLYNADAIWADVAAARQRDPKAFAGLARDRGEFERQILERNGAAAQDAATTAKGSAVAGFVGGLGAGFTDPVNLVFGGAGGKLTGVGKTFAQRMLLEGVVNAGIEAAQTPANIEARARLGEKTDAADVAKDIGMAFGAGMAMHAGATGLERFGSWAYGKAPLDWRAARALDGADPLSASPSHLADAFSARVPDHLRTPDEQAALHVVRRASEIEAVNPYENTYAGQALHQQRLEIASDRLLTGTSRGVVGWADARGLFKAKLRGAESGGNDMAVNPRSSAAGRYQFTDGTWLRLYKERFGDTGASKAEILDKKLDPASQESVMDHALTRYEKAVRDAGQPVTAGNLYLEHFAGEGGARRLFEADGAAMAESVLGAKVVDANPWMRGMSVDDLKAWAARKMGGDAAELRMGNAEDLAGADIEAAMARRDADMAAGELDAAMGRTAPEDIATAVRGDAMVGEPIMPPDPPAMQEMPRLQLELFPDEAAHRAAQEAAAADVLGTTSPPQDAGTSVTGYTTAKGSTYVVHEDGTTTRTKAERNFPGHEGDFGEKPKSAKTVYVDNPQDAARLSAAGLNNLGDKGARVIIRDGKASLLTWNEKAGKWGIAPSGLDIPIHEGPAIGRAPLELWKPVADANGHEAYAGMHAGNAITEIKHSAPKAADYRGVAQSARDHSPSAGAAPDIGDAAPKGNMPARSEGDALPAADLAQPAADVGAEPTGPAAQLQADGLAHDVRADLDAGKLDGVGFAVEGSADPVSAKMAMTRMEAEKAALDALKDCM